MNVPMSEIRKRCMGNRPEFKLKALDHFGIYVTKIALLLNLKPNHLTLLWIIIKTTGILLLIPGRYASSLIGMLLVQLASPIDNSDGQVSRFLNLKSKVGRYADMFSHNILIPLTFISLGLGIYNRFGQAQYLFIGIATALIFLIGEANFKKEVFEYVKVAQTTSQPKRAKKNLEVSNTKKRLVEIKKVIAEWIELEYPLSIMFFGVVLYLWREVLLFYFAIILINFIIKNAIVFYGLNKYDKKYGNFDILKDKKQSTK